jgi:hypothetical protein
MAAPAQPPLSRLEIMLQEACGRRPERLFVLLDAARIAGLPVLLQKLGIPHSCLFRGEVKEDIGRVAPYVARLNFESVHFEWLNVRSDDVPTLLFGISDASGSQIFTHLRRFLLILSPEGQERFFRFYDPRVLAPFLEAGTDAEKRQFFGPISKFLAWDPKQSPRDPRASMLEWTAPALPEPLRYPDAHNPFRLRPAHEEAFAREALARYDERAVQHLRSTFLSRLHSVSADQLRQVIVHAREAGPSLGIAAGRDITRFAEILVMGLTPEIRSEILAAPLPERPQRVAAIRDRLFRALPVL